MSTPRTDKEEKSKHLLLNCDYVVSPNFARTLEIELVTLTRQRDEWREMAHRLASELECYAKYGADPSGEESMKAYAALVKKEDGS